MSNPYISPIHAIAIANGHMKPPSREGVGTELKAMLAKIGIVPTKNCKCNSRAQMMNNMGIEWCEENKDRIVFWLQEEAQNRNLPFSLSAGRFLVKVAISRARRKAR